MLTLYRFLLSFYPSAHSVDYREEMTAVFAEARAEMWEEKWLVRQRFYWREAAGLVRGAVREYLREIPTGRFEMRNGFRFPKATAILMALILGGVVLAIRMGEAIAMSLPNVNPAIGPIQPAPHSPLLPGILETMVVVYAIGTAGWAVLFALRRSGVHRLADAGETK